MRTKWSLFSKPPADPLSDLTGVDSPADVTARWKDLLAAASAAAPIAKPLVPAAVADAAPAKPPVNTTPVDVSKYTVTTIMATPRGGKAVINGHVVGVGQEIDKAKIISISPHEVELEIGGRRVKINI